MTARAQPPRPAQHQGLGGAGLGGVQQLGGPGNDLRLVPAQAPRPERFSRPGQLDLQVVGQVEHRVGDMAGLGQGPLHLVPGELVPGLRHPRWPLRLAAGGGPSADELGRHGMLQVTGARLDPVQGG